MARPSWGLTAVLLSLSVAACAPGGLVVNGEAFDLAALGGKLGGTGDLRSTVERVALATGEESDLAQYLRGPDGKLVDPAQVVWKSSQPGIVEVKQAGRVRAGTTGTALLVAELTGPGGVQKAAIEVAVVEKHPVSLITVEPGKPRLRVGEKLALKATVRLADGQVNGDVAWSSSDPRIASVNEQGELMALKEGSVSILANYKGDGRYRGLAEVEVVASSAAALPSPSPSSITFAPGASALPTAAPSPVLAPSPTPNPSVRPSATPVPPPTEATPTPRPTPTPSPTPTPTPRSYALRFDSGQQILAQRTDNLEFGPNGTLYALSSDSTDRRVSVYRDGAWSNIGPIGSQTLYGQHWFNASHGIVVGNNGVCLRLTEENGTWTTKVLNSKTSEIIRDVYFTNENIGYYCTDNEVWRSIDGGTSWSKWGSGVRHYNPYLTGTPTGEALISGYYSDGYRLSDQGSSKLSFTRNSDGQSYSLSRANFGGGRLVMWGGDGRWHHTSDLQTWSDFSGEFETPTQILRGQPVVVLPFGQGAYLTGPWGGHTFWPGSSGRNSDPSLSSVNGSVVSPEGDLFYVGSQGITRYRPTVSLSDII